MSGSTHTGPQPALAPRWRLTLLLLCVPGLAHPMSLPQLLRLPIEQLVVLEFSRPVPHGAAAWSGTAEPTTPPGRAQ